MGSAMTTEMTKTQRFLDWEAFVEKPENSGEFVINVFEAHDPNENYYNVKEFPTEQSYENITLGFYQKMHELDTLSKNKKHFEELVIKFVLNEVQVIVWPVPEAIARIKEAYEALFAASAITEALQNDKADITAKLTKIQQLDKPLQDLYNKIQTTRPMEGEAASAEHTKLQDLKTKMFKQYMDLKIETQEFKEVLWKEQVKKNKQKLDKCKDQIYFHLLCSASSYFAKMQDYIKTRVMPSKMTVIVDGKEEFIVHGGVMFGIASQKHLITVL